VANFSLSQHFAYFFSQLNPSPSFEQIASRQYATIKGLIEDRSGIAAALAPKCFLQGSYRQQTAIYTINDVDLVVLCELWQPGSLGGGGQSYGRDEIFDIIAAPLLDDGRYRAKVRYGSGSMCIKIDLGIKVEILPVVYKSGNSDPQTEPFRLYRPETGQWEDGFARYHQGFLSLKNAPERTGGNFIPMIKVLKHLRSHLSLDAVSFHIECLLYSLPDILFWGSPANYIPAVLSYIADTPAITWYVKGCLTPCGERNIFSSSEWALSQWQRFHHYVELWAKGARLANQAITETAAIEIWQLVLGSHFFPVTVS
jgi:hypothetical protein